MTSGVVLLIHFNRKTKGKKGFDQKAILKGERIWRSVSLDKKQSREVFNAGDRCERIPLFEVIKFGVLDLGMPVYNGIAGINEKPRKLDTLTIRKKLVRRDTVEEKLFLPDGSLTDGKKIRTKYLFGADLIGYLIAEDWYISSHSGQMEKFVIAMAPVVQDPASGKRVSLFWLDFSEWSDLLSRVFTRINEESMSYERLLIEGKYVAVISKYSNVFDRGIKEGSHGKDVLLESELIKQKIINTEQDLFEK